VKVLVPEKSRRKSDELCVAKALGSGPDESAKVSILRLGSLKM
jgi:hypothetical protein